MTFGDWEGLKWHYHFKQSKYACFIDFRPPEPLPAPLTARLSGAGDGAGAEAGDPRPAVFLTGPGSTRGPVEALTLASFILLFPFDL